MYDDVIKSYDEEDEVVVITSMPLEEDQKDLDEGASEDIQVVTGSSVPVNTWDELEVIEEDVNVSEDLTASIIEDIVSTTTELHEAIKDGFNTEMPEIVTNFEEEETTIKIEIEEQTITNEPTFETMIISSQDNLPATNKQEDIFLNEPTEVSFNEHEDTTTWQVELDFSTIEQGNVDKTTTKVDMKDTTIQIDTTTPFEEIQYEFFKTTSISFLTPFNL